MGCRQRAGAASEGATPPNCGAPTSCLRVPAPIPTRPPQENYFFDGAGQELSSKRVVLRVRFYDVDRKAVLTVKVGAVGAGPFWPAVGGCLPAGGETAPMRACAGAQAQPPCPGGAVPGAISQHTTLRRCSSAPQGKQVLQGGIGRATEEEEPLEPLAARRYLQDPSALLALGTPLMEKLKRCVRVHLIRAWQAAVGPGRWIA